MARNRPTVWAIVYSETHDIPAEIVDWQMGKALFKDYDEAKIYVDSLNDSGLDFVYALLELPVN